MSLGWVRKSAVEVVADQDLGKGGKITRQEELRNKSCHPQRTNLGEYLRTLIVSTSQREELRL